MCFGFGLHDGVGTSVIRHLQRNHPGLPMVLYSGRDLSDISTGDFPGPLPLYLKTSQGPGIAFAFQPVTF